MHNTGTLSPEVGTEGLYNILKEVSYHAQIYYVDEANRTGY